MMFTRKDGHLSWRLLIPVSVVLIQYLELLNAAAIERPDCNRQETFFKPSYIYTYGYTVETSSGFEGVNRSRSGSKLHCTVTLEVPRKCEIILQVSECTLSERNKGDGTTYTLLSGTKDFLLELQKYPVYFQINEGVVVEDSIVVDDQETLQVRNIKRGLISAFQFHILETDQYENPVEQTDVFGKCPTKYTFSSDKPNTVSTYRNLRECELPQVFLHQFNNPASLIKPLTGGVYEGKIKESYYPFTSDVSCDYLLSDDKKLDTVQCLQQHYFKHIAYQGDILASAMATISQSLVLTDTKRDRKSSAPDLGLDGKSVIHIKFEYADDLEAEATLTQIQDALTVLIKEFIAAENSEDYENVPIKFGDLVRLFRHTSQHVLHEIMMDMFDCPSNCKDKSKLSGQKIYLDALETCGTEACLLSFLHCLNEGHVDKFQESQFLHSLSLVHTVPETVQAELYDFCKTSEKSQCWMSLGSIIGSTRDDELKVDSVAYQVIEDVTETIETNCNSDTLQNTERKLNTAVKTQYNIGYELNLRFQEMKTDRQVPGFMFQKCMLNPVLPKSFKRNLLRSLPMSLESLQYRNIPEQMVETLFTVVKETSMDSTLRALAFSQLIKTTDKVTIIRIVEVMLSREDTSQMRAYMTSAVRSLMQNDAPHLKEVREAWLAVEEEHDFNPRFSDISPYAATTSKSINLGGFFKLPITEIFGGQLLLDLVYDPANLLFSDLAVSVNYYYDNKKYNLFETSLNLYGFDLLVNILLQRIDMTPAELYAMYKNMQGQGLEQKQFAKFQQNIVKAVEDILQQVNYPKGLNFDVAVDLRIGGKDVMFGSLQEVISMMQQMKASLPPGKSVLQEYLKKLTVGIPRKLFRSTEFAGIVRSLPTCAGLPLNMTVFWYGTNIIDQIEQSDLLMFMAEKSTSWSATLRQGIYFSNEFHGELTIPIGDVHASGMKAVFPFGSERGVTLKLTYGYDDPMVQVENPSKRQLMFAMSPILDKQESENVLYARGRILLLYHTGLDLLPSDSTVQTTYQSCASPQFAMMFGRQFCINMVYANVTNSKIDAYFPLPTGPFDLQVTMERVDGVTAYEWGLEYEVQKQPGAGYTHHVYMTHYGRGSKLTRYMYSNLVYNGDDHSLRLDAGYPELDMKFETLVTNIWKDGLQDFQVSDWFKRHDIPVLGGIFRVQRKTAGDREDYLFHWNITMPDIGWEVYVADHTVGSYPEYEEIQREVSVSYFCTKERPLLYMFHLLPTWAAVNGDMTKLHILRKRQFSGHGSSSVAGFIELYNKRLTADVTTKGKEGETQMHGTMTYHVGGIERTATMDFMLETPKSLGAPRFTLNLDLDSDQFNIAASGSASVGNKQDVIVTGEFQYTNKQDENVLSRKKRSLKSIFNKFKELEKNAAKTELEVIEPEDALTTDVVEQPVPSQQGPVNTQLMEHFKDLDIPRLSIWDLKQWKAEMDFNGQVKYLFAPGVKPGTGHPEGMQLEGVVTFKHPWNEGYMNYREELTMGRNIKNNYQNFKYWFHGELNTSYTNLDGTPALISNGPSVTTRRGGFFVERRVNEIFNYSMDYKGPDTEKVYAILFDWEAATHHEPLWHVHSFTNTSLMPFINHRYEEAFYYESGHIKHSMDFEHSMLDFQIELDLNLVGEGFIIRQNGSVSVEVMESEANFHFVNTYRDSKFTCELVSGSMPEKTLIYTAQYTGIKSALLSSFVRMDSKEIPLWDTQIALRGASQIEFIVSWHPAYDSKMAHYLNQGPVARAMMLDEIGNHLLDNLDKPFGQQTLLFSSLTPQAIIRLAVMPNFIRGMKVWTNIMANLEPVQYRPTSLEGPGTKIPFRFALLMQAMKKAQTEEPNPLVKKVQYLQYFVLKAISRAMLIVATNPMWMKRVEDILKERQYSFIIDDTWFTSRSLQEFPELREDRKHILTPLEEALGLATSYYRSRSMPLNIKPKVAVIYGPHSSFRALTVRSFDGKHLDISALHTAECSYLLAADLKQHDWSLVLSPAGVTLMTSENTLTIGWDKKVYIDDCKISSTCEKASKAGLIDTDDTRIRVTTAFGLILNCDLTDDVCTVSLELSYQNRTIGLLGTNDDEQFTDQRMKDGKMAETPESFLAEYVVSGPPFCKNPMKAVTSDKSNSSCYDAQEMCLNVFQQSDHYDVLKMCGTVSYSTFCEQEVSLCRQEEVSSCHAFRAYVGLCHGRDALVEPFSFNQAACPSIPPLPESSSAGSLDIVFVVSRHISMAEYRDQPGQLISELASDQIDAWKQFDEVRVGVVGFGGRKADGWFEPHSVILEDNDGRMFVLLDDYDWEDLFQKMPTGNGDEEADGFPAIREAAKFPFSPTSHKMIVLITTKQQSSNEAANLASLTTVLQDQGIILNVISTYSKLASRKVIGVTWDGQVITRKSGYTGNKELPQNDYTALVTATKGALWDLDVLAKGQDNKLNRIVEEFVEQTRQQVGQTCCLN